jgi:FtsZ-interacting cell division protein ZipA
MSDLQLALLVIGAGLIVAVVAYNKWQEIQFRRRTEGAFAERHSDVLLDTPPAPAAATEATTAAAEYQDTTDERIEHQLGEPIEVAAGTERAAATAPPAAPVLDPAIDLIVELRGARVFAGETVTAQAQSLADIGFVKAVRWEGYDAAHASWHSIAAHGRYDRVRVGLQLCDRKGPAAAEDLAAFCEAVRAAASAFAAQVDIPDAAAALQRAQALDRLCAEVDVQIGLSVVGSDAHMFSGSKIRAAAESAGLTLGRDGRFHRQAEDGSELYSLANAEPMPFHPETIKTLQTRGVTALFDVPRVASGTMPFRRYIEFAHQLEHALGGVLVDDHSKPIGQAALEAINQQLDQIHRTMAAHGIPAGGTLARRLFS